ncbi:MAG TPA: histidine phosphatase family protein [Bacteroidales bacterium]|nr:histidine phosphatase family protein [Bacteroidales bacterium]
MKSIKNLYIVRHGKASWDYGNISDIDRPLKERGINDSYTMAIRLRARNQIPDLLLSSPAIRALHTATIFAREFDLDERKLEIRNDLYMSGKTNIIDIIRKTNDNVSSLMIFGHNPGFTDLANYFLINKIDNLPTTGIVTLKFELNSWEEIHPKKCTESDFDYPKNN